MITTARTRLPATLARWRQPVLARFNSTDNPIPANDPNPKPPNMTTSETNAVPSSSQGAWDKSMMELPEDAEKKRSMQAPNRKSTWSRSQMPREKAMIGPRFSQMIFEDQPRPLAAIELIQKQPVRWVSSRIVSCDGGGGPLGHPRIFINVDKPMICMCTYCGLPYAHEHNRHYLESLPSTQYPLKPVGDAAEVEITQRVSDEPFGQR